MKKLFLMLLLVAMAASAQAQSQLTTVRGKTKDGKTIKVEYYQGNVEDYVVSVKYQLVDELQARVDKLQAELDAANKKLKEKPNNNGSANADIKSLNAQIEQLNRDLDRLQNELVSSELSNDSLASANAELKKQLAAKPVNVASSNDKRELLQLRDSIAAKDATIHKLNKKIANCEKKMEELNQELVECHSAPTGHPRPGKYPVLGLELGIGPSFVLDEIEDGWARNVNWAKKVDVYFGTARLSRTVPISIEAGLGVTGIKMTASHSPYVLTENATDVDGESYQATYAYDARAERLSLTYLNIPVRVCFGQPNKNRVSVYTKVGVTPSVKVSSTFEGTGTYSLEGYYPQWDVTLANIDELGFVSDKDCYADVEPDLNGFVLWGNVAVGAYVPIKSFPLIVNAGLNLDIPLMGTGTAANGMSLLGNGGKVIVPSLQVGFVLPL